MQNMHIFSALMILLPSLLTQCSRSIFFATLPFQLHVLTPSTTGRLLVFECATPSLLVFIRSGAPAAHGVSTLMH